jgi:hypothetical protein
VLAFLIHHLGTWLKAVLVKHEKCRNDLFEKADILKYFIRIPGFLENVISK